MRRIGGLRVRWIAPLVHLGHDDWVGELSEAAWGHLEDCGWSAALDAGGEMLDKRKRLRPTWVAAFRSAVDRLSTAGEYAGPESDREKWAAWLCFEMTEPHDVFQATAIQRGWDR